MRVKGRKTKKPRSLTTSGFFGVASIKDAQYGCGGGIWTSRPSGYEPDELPDCSTPRYLVPEAGVEPVREKISRDFKSRASAYSAIPAYNWPQFFRCSYIIAPRNLKVNTFFTFSARFMKTKWKNLFPKAKFIYWHTTFFMLLYFKECAKLSLHTI